jgi:hypothetical protein
MSNHAAVDAAIVDGAHVSKASLRTILKDALGADGPVQAFHAATTEREARDIIGAAVWGGTTGGTATAYTCTTDGEPNAITPGFTIAVVINATNTGAATLSVDGSSAVPIRHADGTTALEAGDLQTNHQATMVYDGSVFRLVGLGNRLRATTGGRVRSNYGAIGPSFIRAWVTFTGTTGVILASYNVSSVVRNSAGNYTITWSENFGTSLYPVFAMAANVNGVGNLVFGESTKTGTSVVILATSDAGALTDSGVVNVMAVVG